MSAVNRAVRAGKATAAEIWKYADAIRADVEAFRAYRKEMGGSIDAFRSFKELHDAAAPYVGPDGRPVAKAVTSRMSNRARTALSRMRASGMEKVYEDARFLVVSPETLAANRGMASVGKWCHTGNSESGTSDAEYYWTEYTSYGPLYYLLDKEAGFVLCASYARQREVRNQFDVLPYRKELGSDEWTVAVDNREVKGDPALKYDCSERDWDSFFAWLDPSGGVSRAVNEFEGEYDRRQAELYRKAFEEQYAPVAGAVTDGVLELKDKETAKAFAGMLRAGFVEMPDAEDYQEGGDMEGEDFEADWDRAEQANDHKRRQFELVQPSITKMFSGLKAIRPGAFAPRLFYDTQYAGELPEIDLAGAESCAEMFAGSAVRTPPSFSNTGGVKDVSGMFRNSEVEAVGELSFPNAERAANMFGQCKKLELVGRLSLPKAPTKECRGLLPSGLKRLRSADLRSCAAPLALFGGLYLKAGDAGCRVGQLLFDSDRFEGFASWQLSDVPEDVFRIVAEATKARAVGDGRSAKLGKAERDRQPQEPFYSKWLDEIDMRDADHTSVRTAMDQFASYGFERLGVPVPDLVFSEKQWNRDVSATDLQHVVRQSKVVGRFSGKFVIIGEDGARRRAPDVDVAKKADGKDLVYDRDGWLLVLSPADARYAAAYHGSLDKVDITEFWDNASYDYSFEIWVKNYLRDTVDDYSVDDDGHVDSDEHTDMPKVRMTRAQWLHRNDNGPVFAHSPNLQYKYGSECGRDDDPPEFVVVQDGPKTVSEAVGGDGFVGDCAAAMHRLGW